MRKPVLLLLVAVLLAACRPAATSQPPAAPPTAIPPTEVPAPTPTPALVESPASSVSDLLGIWMFTVKLRLGADGTFRIYFGSDSTPELIDEGTYGFDTGRLTLTSGHSCTGPATYAAYITRQDGKPVWLRLKVVGNDPCSDRADMLSRAGKFIKP